MGFGPKNFIRKTLSTSPCAARLRSLNLFSLYAENSSATHRPRKYPNVTHCSCGEIPSRKGKVLGDPGALSACTRSGDFGTQRGAYHALDLQRSNSERHGCTHPR